MKKLALLSSLLLAACASQPSPFPPAARGVAEAAAIPAGRTPEERREVFRAAVTLFERGDRSAAEPLFRALLTSYVELADYSLRHLAKSAEARGDLGEAAGLWQSIVERFPDSPWKGEAALALGRIRLGEGDLQAAERWLEAARREPAGPSLHSQALWLSSRAARQRGDSSAARAFARELRSRDPRSAEARLAREEAWSERDRVALELADAARAEASLLLSEGEPERALELVRDAERRFPNDHDFPELLLLEAAALGRTGAREAAVRLLEEIRQHHPKHPAAAAALYRLATLAWNGDEDRTALRLFDLYVRRYPRGEHAAESLYATGRILQEANRFADAGSRFALLARRHRASALAAEAAWRVGWCEYRSGNHRKAARIFQEIARRDGPERAAAVYWRARSLEKTHAPAAGAYDQLLAEFPESYYASLAENRTGRREGAVLSEKADLAPPAQAVWNPAVSDPGWRRFEELRQMGLKGLARVELAYGRKARGEASADLASAWAEVDDFRRSVGVALRLHGCSLRSSLLWFCYPLAYWAPLRREASAKELDPFLVLAVIRQESLFDPEAVSPAGARGLMQLLPSTAARIAREANRGEVPTEALFDVDGNLVLGTAYLRELLDHYRGSVPRAAAAYNAGEQATDKWQRRYGELEDDEFVESISFRETRNYVKRVLQNRRIYRALYANRT